MHTIAIYVVCILKGIISHIKPFPFEISQLRWFLTRSNVGRSVFKYALSYIVRVVISV